MLLVVVFSLVAIVNLVITVYQIKVGKEIEETDNKIRQAEQELEYIKQFGFTPDALDRFVMEQKNK